MDIDTDLTIRSRTLGGRTVGYESLSGGAKEQMEKLAPNVEAMLSQLKLP